MNARINVYDQDTIDYLRAAGVEPKLLQRVEAMAREVAELHAAKPSSRPVAGRSLQDGMRIVMEPGAEVITVRTILPGKSDSYGYVVDELGIKHLMHKASWYAVVEVQP